MPPALGDAEYLEEPQQHFALPLRKNPLDGDRHWRIIYQSRRRCHESLASKVDKLIFKSGKWTQSAGS